VLTIAPRYALSIHAPSADAPATRLVVRAG